MSFEDCPDGLERIPDETTADITRSFLTSLVYEPTDSNTSHFDPAWEEVTVQTAAVCATELQYALGQNLEHVIQEISDLKEKEGVEADQLMDVVAKASSVFFDNLYAMKGASAKNFNSRDKMRLVAVGLGSSILGGSFSMLIYNIVEQGDVELSPGNVIRMALSAGGLLTTVKAIKSMGTENISTIQSNGDDNIRLLKSLQTINPFIADVSYRVAEMWMDDYSRGELDPSTAN